MRRFDIRPEYVCQIRRADRRFECCGHDRVADHHFASRSHELTRSRISEGLHFQLEQSVLEIFQILVLFITCSISPAMVSGFLRSTNKYQNLRVPIARSQYRR